MAITILSHCLNSGSALILQGIGNAKASWRVVNFLKPIYLQNEEALGGTTLSPKVSIYTLSNGTGLIPK